MNDALFEEMRIHLILVRTFLKDLIKISEGADMPNTAAYTKEMLNAIETTLKKIHYDHIRNAK